MHDSSGFNRHGEFYPDAVFGLNSPIETDPSSKAIFGRAGFKDADDVPDLSNAHTWIVWGFNDSSGAKALIGRNNQWSLANSNLLGYSAADLAATRFSDGAGNNQTLDFSVAPDAWFMLARTRSTNVGRLYVNGVLRDETTTLSVGAFSYDGDAGLWTIGESSGPTSGFYASSGVDEPALFDYALTAAEILAIYESALASLPISCTISVRVVVELDTDQVTPVDFPFTHNFAEPIQGSPRPIVEHLAWKTNVNQSEPDYQQRINAQPYHAERTLEYFVTPTSARARSMMQAALWTPGQTYKLPICKDWGELTAQAGASANTLSLDTTLKDYEIGSYVVVWEDVYQPWTAQFFEITSRTDTQLGISPNVGTALPIGSPVMPARLAILPEDSLSIDSHLIDRETAALQFEILSTELSSRRVTAYVPDEEYLDIEVFSLERVKVEWVDPAQYQINRRQQGTGTPTGNDFTRAIDTGSPQAIPLRVLLTSEEAISEFYGWMEDRQGKQNPIWIASEENDLNVTARNAGTITIDHVGYTKLYNAHSARRHLAFKKTDGSTVYKMITAAVDDGNGTETLSVDTPPNLVDIAKTSFLRLATAPDQFELKYYRDGAGFIAECEFVMTELLSTPEP